MHQLQLLLSGRCKVSAAGRPGSAWRCRAKAQCCGVQAAEVRWARWARPLQCLMDVWQARGLGRGLSWKRDPIKRQDWDVGLPSGRLSWMNDKNLLRRKGRAWLKGLMAFTLTGWLISHYSSRMWLSEGNSRKCLILSNIDYLKRSFCINPNTFFYRLWFELAQQELSDSQVEPLQNLSTIGAPSFKARSQYLRHLRGSDLLSSCYTLWHPNIPPHLPCPLHVFRCLEVLLTSWAQACKWRNHDCNCSTAWLRGPDSHLITTWLLPTWGTLLWISLKKQNSALLLMTSTSRGSSFHVLHLKCYSGSSVCWCHPSTAAEPEIKRERWNSAFTLHTQDHT